MICVVCRAGEAAAGPGQDASVRGETEGGAGGPQGEGEGHGEGDRNVRGPQHAQGRVRGQEKCEMCIYTAKFSDVQIWLNRAYKIQDW